jgi:hypothetical protein
MNIEDGVECAKRSDRLRRSVSARMARQKAKAIKKLKDLKKEAEAFRIFNKGIGK